MNKKILVICMLVIALTVMYAGPVEAGIEAGIEVGEYVRVSEPDGHDGHDGHIVNVKRIETQNNVLIRWTLLINGNILEYNTNMPVWGIEQSELSLGILTKPDGSQYYRFVRSYVDDNMNIYIGKELYNQLNKSY